MNPTYLTEVHIRQQREQLNTAAKRYSITDELVRRRTRRPQPFQKRGRRRSQPVLLAVR